MPFAAASVRKSGAKIAAMAAQGGRKRIFLGLLAASCGCVCMLLFIFLILPWLWPVSHWLAAASIAIGSICILLLAWLCLTLVFQIYTGRHLPGISGMRHLCTRIFLPLMEMVGKLARIDKNTVRRSLVKVNNEIVLAHRPAPEPAGMLLLLPHCMQSGACRIRLDKNLSHCANCGRCQIGQIRALALKYGFHVAIATGGTIARKIVAQIRPDIIVAIACERDLVSGIQDTYPIPVFGILNERPDGPCQNTLAPMQTLVAALAFFMDLPQTALQLEAQPVKA